MRSIFSSDLNNVINKNIYYSEGTLTAGYLNNDGEESNDGSVNAYITDYIPISPNNMYIFLADSVNNPAGYNMRIWGYNSNKEKVSMVVYKNIPKGNSDVQLIFNTGLNICYIRLSLYRYTTIKNKRLYLYNNGNYITAIDSLSRYELNKIISDTYSVQVNDLVFRLTTPGVTAAAGAIQANTVLNKCRTNFLPVKQYGYLLELVNNEYEFTCWFYGDHKGAAYATVQDSPLNGGVNHIAQNKYIIKSDSKNSRYVVLSFGRCDKQDLNMNKKDENSDYNKILNCFKLYSNPIDAYDECNKLCMHEKTANKAILSVIKRARQLTDTEWTPAVDIPRVSCMNGNGTGGGSFVKFNDIFKAGVTYKGLPYSTRNVIGHTISIRGFITAVEDANSIECKESEYVDSLTASYYGTTCMTLVGHALNIPQLYPNNYLDAPGFVKKFDVFEDNVYHDTDDYELCDILGKQNDSGVHVAIITDIIRERNYITHIEVSESTISGNVNRNIIGGQLGGMCRRKMWPVDEFNLYWKAYTVYKYNYLDTVPYIADKYAPMNYEQNYVQAHNLPLIPYKGDYCKYYSYGGSVTVKLLINVSDFTHLRVMKNGVGISLINIENNDGYIDLELGPDEAEYKAYLCTVNENNGILTNSHPCYWMIINNGSIRCTLSANHIYTIICKRHTKLLTPFIIEFDNDHLHGGYHLITDLDYEVEFDDAESMYVYTIKTSHPHPGIGLHRIKIWFYTANYSLVSGNIGNTINFS